MKNRHILVVDDDRALRTLYQALLESYGYTSDTADNGRDAIAQLARESYDAILLDYMMPEITGLTVLRHIQQRYRSLPVVILTGHTDEKVAEQAFAGGARACLYKPFECHELKEVLNGCTDRSRG
ncbi:MAG: response regulator [Nitrospirales bacterium]